MVWVLDEIACITLQEPSAVPQRTRHVDRSATCRHVESSVALQRALVWRGGAADVMRGEGTGCVMQ